MSSIVAGGIFNAMAFAGAGFLFSKLNKEGYKDEMRRHNEAMEKLTKAKEEWYERNVARKDRMAQLRLELDDANKDFAETNRALKTLEQATKVDREPTIHNFYEPSDEMKKYQYMTMGIAGLASGIVGTVLIKSYGL